MKLLLVAVGQRLPAWADAAFDEFAKRFPPEMRLELKAVKAEPRDSRTAAQLMAAEAKRIEAALPRGVRRVALDEHGSRVTTRQLADRLADWQRDGRDVALLVGGPDGLDAGAEGALRREPAPVGPDPAACLRARAAGRSALPRLVASPANHPYHREVTRAPPSASSTSPRRARGAASCWRRSACATSCCWPMPMKTPKRSRRERPGELPAVYVERVTRAKLVAARERLAAARPAAGADPLRRHDRRARPRILGKPVDAADAARTLRPAVRPHAPRADRRGGRAGRGDGDAHAALALVSVSHVRFAALAGGRIDRYVASGEPFGKAGAYAIQSAAAAWIERIEGSYSAIMGLPLHETATLLRQAGVAVSP